MPKVSEVIPTVGGLFTAMDYDFAGSNNTLLDLLLQQECGERLVSPFVERLMPKFSDSKQLTDDVLKTLGMLILTQYKHKWDGWNELYHLKYDPIHNYYDSMKENVSDLLSSSDQETAHSQTSSVETGTQLSTMQAKSEQISEGKNEVTDTSSSEGTSGVTHSGSDTEKRDLNTETKLVKSGGSDTEVTTSGTTSEKLSGTDGTIRTLALKDVKSINSDKTEEFTDNTSDKTVTDGGLTTTRTDNLQDKRDGTTTSTSTRTDNLTQTSSSTQSSDSQSSSDDSVHAFNTPSGTVTAENSALVSGEAASQLATFTTTVHGVPSDSNLSASKGSQSASGTVQNTGTVSTDGSGTEDDTITHTGTQETVESNNSTVIKTVTGSKNTTINEVGGETVDHTGTDTTDVTYGKKSDGSTSGSSKTNVSLDETDTTTQTGSDTLTKTYGEKVDNTSHDESSSTSSSVANSTTTTDTDSQSTGTSVKDASQLADTRRLADSLATASRVRTVVREGNIGNITTQKFILEQIEVLRQNFIHEVITDVKDFITVPIYK